MSDRRRRILVTGSRTAQYDLHHGQVLRAFIAYEESDLRKRATDRDGYSRNLVIVHGDARGLDTIAKIVAEKFGHRAEAHPAKWEGANNQRDPSAGPRRNQEMVDLGAEVCLAFRVEGQEARGTEDCARRATAAGIPVVWHTLSALPGPWLEPETGGYL